MKCCKCLSTNWSPDQKAVLVKCSNKACTAQCLHVECHNTILGEMDDITTKTAIEHWTTNFADVKHLCACAVCNQGTFRAQMFVHRKSGYREIKHVKPYEDNYIPRAMRQSLYHFMHIRKNLKYVYVDKSILPQVQLFCVHNDLDIAGVGDDWFCISKDYEVVLFERGFMTSREIQRLRNDLSRQ